MLRGKTIIVTGANSGIGKATAAEMLRCQGRVIMACRNRERAEKAAQEIQQEAGPEQGELVIKLLDLASLKSVRSFCEEIMKVTCYIKPSTECLFLFSDIQNAPVNIGHAQNALVELLSNKNKCTIPNCVRASRALCVISRSRSLGGARGCARMKVQNFEQNSLASLNCLSK